MIRNIVFDLGRVLVGFDPEGYLRSFGFDEETVQRFLKVIFGPRWRFYDRGDYASVTDLGEELAQEFPKDADMIRKVLRPDWVKIHTLKEDTAAYLHELKTRGYRVYMLSNLAKESYDYVRGYDFFSELDGGVFSFQEHVCKPDEKIYRILLERYALLPEETLFLDDSAENIETAQRLGMHGIVFTELSAAKAQTEQKLLLP